MRRRRGVLVLTFSSIVLPTIAHAATLEPVAGGFDQPVYVASDPSDPDRLYVVEREGVVSLVENGIASTFLDLASTGTVIDGPEQGLLSIAFAPDYPSTGHLYVFYARDGTPDEAGDIQIDEFTAAGDTVPLASRRAVITIEHSADETHYGGQLQFGPDGYLYISTGDGAAGGDPLENGQSPTSRLGKILRIDPAQAGADPYSVPPDNPFAGAVPGADEIWSLGLRNPWRFSFDRLTGDLLIGDVGQDAFEEIDYRPARGAGRAINFGWDCREGRHDFELTGCPAPATLTDPIFEYAHSPTFPSSVTGGYVVRDPTLDDLYGRYVYADFALHQIRSLVPGLPDALDACVEPITISAPVSFGEDSAGRVYVLSFSGGVYRLQPDGTDGCDDDGSPVAAPPVCAGKTATVIAGRGVPAAGGDGDDVIAGSAGADRIRGGRGDDTICGLDKGDHLSGGRGADLLKGGTGRDRCKGGPGEDRLRSC